MQKLTTKEQWIEWLEKMHKEMIETTDDQQRGRFETVASMFGFCTYDGHMDEALVNMVMPTLLAIANKTTFDLIKDPQAYQHFCIAINMPILQRRLNWGTSIRGAWYDFDAPFDPHVGLIGRGSTGCDLIDAAPIGKGDEDSFIELLLATVAFLEPDPEVTRTRQALYRYWSSLTSTRKDVNMEWLHWPTFEVWAMANGYKVGLRLKRIDPEAGVNPDNAVWVERGSNPTEGE